MWDLIAPGMQGRERPSPWEQLGEVGGSCQRGLGGEEGLGSPSIGLGGGGQNRLSVRGWGEWGSTCMCVHACAWVHTHHMQLQV